MLTRIQAHRIRLAGLFGVLAGWNDSKALPLPVAEGRATINIDVAHLSRGSWTNDAFDAGDGSSVGCLILVRVQRQIPHDIVVWLHFQVDRGQDEGVYIIIIIKKGVDRHCSIVHFDFSIDFVVTGHHGEAHRCATGGQRIEGMRCYRRQ